RRPALGGGGADEPRDRAEAGDGVEAAAGVLAEGVQARDEQALPAVAPERVGAVEGADFPAPEVAVEVAAVEAAEAGVADDVAADHAAALAEAEVVVGVGEEGRGEGRLGRFAGPAR